MKKMLSFILLLSVLTGCGKDTASDRSLNPSEKDTLRKATQSAHDYMPLEFVLEKDKIRQMSIGLDEAQIENLKDKKVDGRAIELMKEMNKKLASRACILSKNQAPSFELSTLLQPENTENWEIQSSLGGSSCPQRSWFNFFFGKMKPKNDLLVDLDMKYHVLDGAKFVDATKVDSYQIKQSGSFKYIDGIDKIKSPVKLGAVLADVQVYVLDDSYMHGSGLQKIAVTGSWKKSSDDSFEYYTRYNFQNFSAHIKYNYTVKDGKIENEKFSLNNEEIEKDDFLVYAGPAGKVIFYLIQLDLNKLAQ